MMSFQLSGLPGKPLSCDRARGVGRAAGDRHVMRGDGGATWVRHHRDGDQPGPSWGVLGQSATTGLARPSVTGVCPDSGAAAATAPPALSERSLTFINSSPGLDSVRDVGPSALPRWGSADGLGRRGTAAGNFSFGPPPRGSHGAASSGTHPHSALRERGRNGRECGPVTSPSGLGPATTRTTMRSHPGANLESTLYPLLGRGIQDRGEGGRRGELWRRCSVCLATVRHAWTTWLAWDARPTAGPVARHACRSRPQVPADPAPRTQGTQGGCGARAVAWPRNECVAFVLVRIAPVVTFAPQKAGKCG